MTLKRLCLVDVNDNVTTIHRLVQEIIRKKMKEEGELENEFDSLLSHSYLKGCFDAVRLRFDPQNQSHSHFLQLLDDCLSEKSLLRRHFSDSSLCNKIAISWAI